jgi:hypothetical protein
MESGHVEHRRERAEAGAYFQKVNHQADQAASIGTVMTVPISATARISPQALTDLLGRWPATGSPLYRLLAARIGRLADTGELPPGIRLPPPAALAPRAPNVVTIGSFSKTYWGGLRTGWVRAPEGIIARLAAAKAAADLGSPPYQQAIVAALVSRHHEEIIKRRLDWIRPGCEALAGAMTALLPRWAWKPPAGGLTIWSRLPGDADAGAFTQAALRQGIAVIPGRCCRCARTAPPGSGWPSPGRPTSSPRPSRPWPRSESNRHESQENLGQGNGPCATVHGEALLPYNR